MTTALRRLLAGGLCAIVIGGFVAAWLSQRSATDHQRDYRRALEQSMTKARDLDVECARADTCDQKGLRRDKSRLAQELVAARTDAEKALAVARLVAGVAAILGAVAALIMCWLVWSSGSTKGGNAGPGSQGGK